MQEADLYALCQLIVTLAWQLLGMFTVIQGGKCSSPNVIPTATVTLMGPPVFGSGTGQDNCQVT